MFYTSIACKFNFYCFSSDTCYILMIEICHTRHLWGFEGAKGQNRSSLQFLRPLSVLRRMVLSKNKNFEGTTIGVKI